MTGFGERIELELSRIYEKKVNDECKLPAKGNVSIQLAFQSHIKTKINR